MKAMLLAIDTATSYASIALHDGAILRGECTWEAANRHTVTLMARIEQMLSASELGPTDLTAVAVCTGPGSYTGVRIGVSAAKGIAIPRALPLVGVTTLDILVAAQPPDPRPLFALFAAGRKRVGYAIYRWRDLSWHVTTPVEIAGLSDLARQMTEPSLVVGEFPPQWENIQEVLGDYAEFPPPARHLRRAGFLADLAWMRLQAGDTHPLAEVVPLYTR
ncbi:MAG: tRNA (adenosine(37)-N6)-threonylcarbamoyltransferase complex dimerization subunit type 1 TsaB [Anaerolineae bacterium]|nr:tRNA (adenosine(37)-N6)-threonylcarbamoyltransferase complex dimerization subunit type 1 TsaB [Anaerolineae bacterium]